MSDIHRFLGPVQWKTEKTSEWTIATIISDDVLILPHRANPVGWNFREPQVRTHLSLGKDAPCTRPIERFGDIIAQPILGGLHHRYARI